MIKNSTDYYKNVLCFPTFCPWLQDNLVITKAGCSENVPKRHFVSGTWILISFPYIQEHTASFQKNQSNG